MNIKAHWITLAATVLLLGACSTSPTNDSSTTSTASTASGKASSSDVTTSTVVSDNTNTLSAPIIQPGSIDDFMLNISDRVFFDFDRYNLTSKATEVLDSQVRWLKRFPNVGIVIGGHADKRGTREYNLALSERRAQVVRDYMVGLGINADRIRVVAYGKERLALLQDSAEAHAANRRAVTKIQTQ